MEAIKEAKSAAQRRITRLVCKTKVDLALFDQTRSAALEDRVKELSDACEVQLQALTDAVDELYWLDPSNADAYADEQALSEKEVDDVLQEVRVARLKAITEVKEKGHITSAGTCARQASSSRRAEGRISVTVASVGSVRWKGRTKKKSKRRSNNCQESQLVSVRNVQKTPRIEVGIASDGVKTITRLSLPDSGADVNLMSSDWAKDQGLVLDKEDTITIRAANHNSLKVDGSAQTCLTYQGQSAPAKIYVSPSMKEEFLISCETLKQLRILPENFPNIMPVMASVATSDEQASGKDPDMVPVVASAATSDEQAPGNDDLHSLESIKEAYSDVLSDDLSGKERNIVGGEMKIHLRPGPIVPVRVGTAPQIPRHWQKLASEHLEVFLRDGVLTRVNEPTDWISRGFWVPKPGRSDSLRLVTDFIKLNSYVQRPVHPFPTSQSITRNIDPGSKWFAKLDAIHGYFQIPLEYESSLLTTFLLPQGRFRYLCAPMGLSASSDEWCSRSDEAIQGVPGTQKIVDDILVAAPTEQELLRRVGLVLEGCRTKGITISHRKLEVDQEIKFAGFVVNGDGVKPNPEKLEGIMSFPVPTNTGELKSFLGMVGQLDWFLPDLTHSKEPLHGLTKKNVVWQWLDDHQKAFEEVKLHLSTNMINHHFDEGLPTELLTDASRLKGLGFALIQRDGDKIKMIQCGSRSLTSAERNYAVCELEALAIEWAINKKVWWWLRGCNEFKVMTDHRPLVGIFKKPIDEVENTRLQRFRLKLQGYNFTVEYVPGKEHLIADALSRAPVFSPPEEESADEALKCRSVFEARVMAVHNDDYGVPEGVGVDQNLLDLIEKAKMDVDYQRVVVAFKNGEDPSKLSQNHPSRAYKSIWNDVSLFDDQPLLVYQGHRIVVPPSCRARILDILHKPHVGQTKTKKNAQQLYFWPGMTNDIKNVVEKCDECRQRLNMRADEPLQQTAAEYPFQMVSLDLFAALNQIFLITADRYSGMVYVDKLRSETTAAIVTKLEQRFDDMATRPQTIRSDGGPCFRSQEFKAWCADLGIAMEQMSGKNSPSNGHAEASVANAKHLLLKCGKYTQAFHSRLREWLNCPRADGYSPAQMLYGFRQKGDLPALPSAYNRINHEDAEMKRQERQDANKDYHDQRTKPIPPLAVGTPVWILNHDSKLWDIEGVIIRLYRNNRSYLIELDNGRYYFRNRKFVRPRKT